MSELRYWASIFVQGDEGSCVVSVTDGDYTPHTRETVKATIETRFGAVDRIDTAGPMLTNDNAESYILAAANAPDGFDRWLSLAQ